MNDRGPFVKGRILDLTKKGASELGFISQGTAKVRITALGETETYQYGSVSTERFKEQPDFTVGEFFVQVGSFTNDANAKRLKNKLLSWGRKSVIQKFDRGDKIFYRVQVRAGKTLPEAEHVEDFRTLMDPSIKYTSPSPDLFNAINNLFRAGTNQWVNAVVYDVYPGKNDSLDDTLARAIDEFQEVAK